MKILSLLCVTFLVGCQSSPTFRDISSETTQGSHHKGTNYSSYFLSEEKRAYRWLNGLCKYPEDSRNQFTPFKVFENKEGAKSRCPKLRDYTEVDAAYTEYHRYKGIEHVNRAASGRLLDIEDTLRQIISHLQSIESAVNSGDPESARNYMYDVQNRLSTYREYLDYLMPEVDKMFSDFLDPEKKSLKDETLENYNRLRQFIRNSQNTESQIRSYLSGIESSLDSLSDRQDLAEDDRLRIEDDVRSSLTYPLQDAEGLEYELLEISSSIHYSW